MRGLLIALLLAFVPAAPALAAWRVAETANFRVHSEGSEKQLRQMAALLEDYDALLRVMTGITAPPAAKKLDIYLVANGVELRSVRTVPTVALGFYSATPGGIAAVSIRGDRPFIDSDEVLLHEYAHHFMLQYSPYPYPAWYVEGFAEYMMTAQFDATNISVGKSNIGRAYSLVADPWVPLRKILSGDTAKLDQKGFASFYAQSWLMTHFFYSVDGYRDKLMRYLALEREGRRDEAAFKEAVGMDYAAFTKALKTYVAGRLTYLKIARKSDRVPAAITVRTLPPAADDLLLPSVALRLGVGEARRQPLLDRIRRAAAAHPGDPFARRVMAEAEVDFGDRPGGIAMLDALLAEQPGDVETLYLRGEAELQAARDDDTRRDDHLKAARAWFGKGFKVDPNHVPTLYAYTRAFPDQAANANRTNVLMKARALAPQVDEIGLAYAVALTQTDRFAEAEAVLLSLRADPHGNAAYAANIATLLKLARDHERAPPEGLERPADETPAG